MPRTAQLRDTGLAEFGAGEAHAYAHTLSMRLTAEQYRQLRRFVARHEDRTDQRMTHQAVLERALKEYLDKNATPLG